MPSGSDGAVPSPPAGFLALRVLGRGATTLTFLVTRGETIAVCKRLVRRAVSDATARADLVREGRVLAALSLEPHVAPRFVQAGDDEHGPFLVMEHVALATFAAELAARSGAPRASWIAATARAAFGALDAVHGARDASGPLDVRHGDLAPENLLVSEDGARVVLVDFGLATFRDDSAPPGGAFRGSLLYAAPWLARGEGLDAAADRFALAALLAHAILDEPPRRATSPAALLLEAGETPLDAFAARAASAFRAAGAEDVAARVTRDLAFARPTPR